jgi:hypothetical protein
MKTHHRLFSQLAFAAVLIGGLYVASALAADNSAYCQNQVGQKAGAQGGRYQPDNSTKGSQAALILESGWSTGFEHHFGGSRQPDYEVIPVTSTVPLPVKSGDISVALSGSLRRLDKSSTIAQTSFVGAAIIGSDGKHVSILICLDPATTDPGEYRGAIQVYAATGVDPLAIPVDVTFQPENPVGYFVKGAVIVVLGMIVKVLGDLEKLSAKPDGRIAFRAVWHMYRADWARIVIIGAGLLAGVIALLISYFRNPALVGGFDDIWSMAAAVLAAEFGIGSVTDLAAFIRPPTVQDVAPAPAPPAPPAPPIPAVG